jgi:hypothetical protein
MYVSLTPSTSAHIRGFKEIRHAVGSQQLSQIFPHAKYIVNTRINKTRQRQSAFYRKQSVQSILTKESQLSKALAQIPTKNIFYLPLEEFSVSSFNALLRWLGITSGNFTCVLHNNKANTYNYHYQSCFQQQ